FGRSDLQSRHHGGHRGHGGIIPYKILPPCPPCPLWWRAIAVLLLLPAVSSAQPRLTFHKDIAPIVWHRCATCHRPGEVGPFSLLTYDDVKARAAQIAAVTARRIMPPWKPEPGKGEFQDERRLKDDELQMLQ